LDIVAPWHRCGRLCRENQSFELTGRFLKLDSH
jgi:hypothetical protein